MKKKLIVPRIEVKGVTSLRLKPSRKLLLKKAAAMEGCTMNALLEAVIDEWLKGEGLLK